jgi:tetratricopeptide (TPR) repeat protein
VAWELIDAGYKGDARGRLVGAVRGKQRPNGRSEFPGSNRPGGTEHGSRPRRPGSLPGVWNMPPSNATFTGCDRMLVDLRERLVGDRQVVVHALHGMGGVGKTQLAIEYAYRFAGEYELVWWIASEQPELIGEQFGRLAVALRLAAADGDAASAVQAARQHLRSHDRVLLIFDNAARREDVYAWLPGGPAHILITSRDPLWSGVAQPVEVDVFARSESVTLLHTTVPRLSADDAERVAVALGDLPLAVAQAGDLLAETGMPVDEYLHELAEHTADATGDRAPVGYPEPLAAAVTLAAGRLHRHSPAAGQLLSLCAYLAPEPVPLDLFQPDLAGLPAELAAVAGNTTQLRLIAARLTRYGLARRVGEDGLQLHRLTQAILRDTDPDRDDHRRIVERIVIAVPPDDDGTTPALWQRWSQLPHILACEPATTGNTELRWLAYHAAWHLLARGDAHTTLPLAEQLHSRWTDQHGHDDEVTLSAGDLLAYAHRELGHYQQARDYDQQTFDRRRRLLGYDHQHTLISANNLQTLDEYEQARQLYQDALDRRRRLLGDDHPDTMSSANNLAECLLSLGEDERAHQLHRDTLDRRRRVLGEDHPSTLKSARNLRAVGGHDQTPHIAQDTVPDEPKSISGGGRESNPPGPDAGPRQF